MIMKAYSFHSLLLVVATVSALCTITSARAESQPGQLVGGGADNDAGTDAEHGITSNQGEGHLMPPPQPPQAVEVLSSPRQLQEELIERRDCVPFENLPSYVFDDVRTETVCLTNSCGGCCRIYQWLFCDTNNSNPFNACVCNGRTRTDSPTQLPTISPRPTTSKQPTSHPTFQPTSSPTISPTFAPTASPTMSPTSVPTAAPTKLPTASPTAAPTASPTDLPTMGPTSSPTVAPTAAPTMSPTIGPTSAPTTGPTNSPTEPISTTIETKDTDGNPVWESTCPDLQSFINRLTEQTFQYSYNVQQLQQQSSSPLETIEDELHASMVREFLKCHNTNTATDDFIIWIQSRKHVTTNNCGTDCTTMQAPLETLWIVDNNRRRKLQQALEVREFLKSTMNNGNYDTDMYTVKFVDDDTTATTAPTMSPTDGTSTTTGRGPGIDGAEQQIGGSNNDDDDDKPSVGIIVAAVVAGIALIALIVLAVARNRDQKATEYSTDDVQRREYEHTPETMSAAASTKRRLAYDMEEATEQNLQERNEKHDARSAYLADAERELMIQMMEQSEQAPGGDGGRTNPRSSSSAPSSAASSESVSPPIEGHLILDTDDDESEDLRVVRTLPSPMRSTKPPSPTKTNRNRSPSPRRPMMLNRNNNNTNTSTPNSTTTAPLQEQDDLRNQYIAQRVLFGSSELDIPAPIPRTRRSYETTSPNVKDRIKL